MITRTLKELEDFGFFDYLKDTRIVIYKYGYPFSINNDILFKETDHSKYIIRFIKAEQNIINIWIDYKED